MSARVTSPSATATISRSTGWIVQVNGMTGTSGSAGAAPACLDRHDIGRGNAARRCGGLVLAGPWQRLGLQSSVAQTGQHAERGTPLAPSKGEFNEVEACERTVRNVRGGTLPRSSGSLTVNLHLPDVVLQTKEARGSFDAAPVVCGRDREDAYENPQRMSCSVRRGGGVRPRDGQRPGAKI